MLTVYNSCMGCLSLQSYRSIENTCQELFKRVSQDTFLIQSYLINFYSVYWDGKYYRMADYGDLLPSFPPRVIDPANPANNVWESGIIGDSSILVKNIDTIYRPLKNDLRTTNNTVTVLDSV